MKTINVVMPPFREPTFGSPEEAIADGRRRDNNAVSNTLRGLRVQAVSWSDTDFIVRFHDAALGLRLWCDDLDLGAEIIKNADDSAIRNTADDELADVLLRFPKSGESVWKRREIADLLLGKTIGGLTLGIAMAFLGTREASPSATGVAAVRPRALIIHFGVLIDGANDKPFLHWSQSQ